MGYFQLYCVGSCARNVVIGDVNASMNVKGYGRQR